MKIWKHRSYISLSSILTAISCSQICVVGDHNILASTNILQDIRQLEDYYLDVDDDLLSEIPEDIVHSFRNAELELRIAQVAPELLSNSQKDYLRNVLRQKSGHSPEMDEDIRYFIKLLKSCSRVEYYWGHNKTNAFVRTKTGELRADDILDVLHNLKFEDWSYATRSVNWEHIGDTLFVFKPKVDWITIDGKQLKNVKLYIKLDVDETTRNAVALVSMHT